MKLTKLSKKQAEHLGVPQEALIGIIYVVAAGILLLSRTAEGNEHRAGGVREPPVHPLRQAQNS